jgi:hypothetical protein
VIQAWEDDMARAESARLDLVAINEESMVEAADLGAADCAEPAFETP